MTCEMRSEVLTKFERLQRILKEMGKLVVAYSGGVDSTFLMRVAFDCLGEGAVALTARHHAVPQREQTQAAEFCSQQGMRMLAVEVDEMKIPGFAENGPERCYLCKKAIFQELIRWGREVFQGEYGQDWFLVDGSNVDDQGDYRPGMKALKELEVRSPLQEAGLCKSDIRALSRMLNLPTWDMPSFACLASRFVYGEQITPEKLKQVEEAEEYLRALGFKQYRVRMHGSLARIEVLPEEIEKLVVNGELIHGRLRELGFTYVTMDLHGFQSGSMNREISSSKGGIS